MTNLKFRFWDIGAERFTYSDEYANLSSFFQREELFGKEGSLQQYTGQKDSIGREIYEGDIVKYDCGSSFDNEHYLKLLISAVFYENCKYRTRYSADSYVWNRMTIIGNIFETPELIN